MARLARWKLTRAVLPEVFAALECIKQNVSSLNIMRQARVYNRPLSSSTWVTFVTESLQPTSVAHITCVR